MADIIDFDTRSRRPPCRCGIDGMISQLETLILRARAGQITAVGIATVLSNGNFYTFTGHKNDTGIELGTAILALQQDYVASFSATDEPPPPEDQAPPPSPSPEEAWVKNRTGGHPIPLADPEE